VALTEGEHVVFERRSKVELSHASLLGEYVSGALKFIGGKPAAVAVSGGPGSYTGLRIGCSMAKGLCYGLGIPLISLPTLYILATKAVREFAPSADALLCPMLDARRMEVYASVYDVSLQTVRSTEAYILTPSSFNDITVTGRTLYFFGNGASKFQALIEASNAVFAPLEISAADMASAAYEAFGNKRFEDTAYYEPFYLKDFIATKPKKSLFLLNN
jgi:tRNA threonylcarbamoyladenosine biosynthesis protein TsaB